LIPTSGRAFNRPAGRPKDGRLNAEEKPAKKRIACGDPRGSRNRGGRPPDAHHGEPKERTNRKTPPPGRAAWSRLAPGNANRPFVRPVVHLVASDQVKGWALAPGLATVGPGHIFSTPLRCVKKIPGCPLRCAQPAPVPALHGRPCHRLCGSAI